MYKLPTLPFDYDALEPYLDAKTLEIHHSRHHAAYVKNLNDLLKGHHEDLFFLDVNELMTYLPNVPQDIRVKVTNNGGGHANHSFFWKVLSPEGGEPEGDLKQALWSTFGSVDLFKEKFSAAALGLFGSGWTWLVSDKKGKLAIETTPNQISPLSAGRIPLLTLDVWEHAYYLKYQNKRADYIAAWWNVVNWKQVETNLKNI